MLTRSEVEGMELDAAEMDAVIQANTNSTKSAGGWIALGFAEAKRQMLVHFPAPLAPSEPTLEDDRARAEDDGFVGGQ